MEPGEDFVFFRITRGIKGTGVREGKALRRASTEKARIKMA
jgi:hypothetical protein